MFLENEIIKLRPVEPEDCGIGFRTMDAKWNVCAAFKTESYRLRTFV